jgi:hypothetical protein
MKTLIAFLLCAAAVCGSRVRAGESDPAAGKVLILDNERTLEGDIEQIGDQYRVRRTLGVTWVPAARVLRLCGDKAEALAFLRKRANLDDADERLRLARWCHLQGLREEALAEVKEAVRLRPEHDESRRLQQYLEQSQRAAAAEPAQAPAKPATRPAPKLSVELSAESMSLFTTRVQPILMNACAKCHLADGAGAFKLERAHEIGAGNRRAVQQNLAAVLAQLNYRQPELSPFLIKATSAHGPAGEAPLRGQQAAAYRTLEDWVKLTLARHAGLRETEPETPRPMQPLAREASGEKPPRPAATFAADKAPAAAAKPQPALTTESPETPRDGATHDEYDPAEFNRLAQPGKPPQ